MISRFYRNGEDAEFDFPKVMDVALEVINGPHEFDLGLDHRGMVLTFFNDRYRVEVLLERFLTGECVVMGVKPGRSSRSAGLPAGLR